MSVDLFIKQALAMANNFIHTGRNNEAIQMLSQINKVDPGNPVTHALMDYIVSGHSSSTEEIRHENFGLNWRGEDLEGKSIQVICDQGMGDTINCLRYLQRMKLRWGCKIVLNCHAFFEEFERLIGYVNYVDEFVKFSTVCDYHTNILSIAPILNEIPHDVYYPARWQELLETPIPAQPLIEIEPNKFSESAFRVGVAWHSNLENPIGQKKSIGLGQIATLEDGINELWSLIPSAERTNILVQPTLNDLYDTAQFIMAMDVVVSVDTVTLHLAGTLNKKTLGLLPCAADARWAMGSTTPWYPSIELFRQKDNGDWNPTIYQVKKRLEALRSLS